MFSVSDADKVFVKKFADDGYAIIDPEIDEPAIDSIVEALALQFAKITNDDYRIQDAWKFNEAVKKMAVSEAVMVMTGC